MLGAEGVDAHAGDQARIYSARKADDRIRHAYAARKRGEPFDACMVLFLDEHDTLPFFSKTIRKRASANASAPLKNIARIP